MKHNSIFNVVTVCGLVAWMLVATAGCKHDATPGSETIPTEATQPDDPHAGHNHGPDETGPHGGHLVELGKQLHAEWTHNDATGEVVVYLLDSAAEVDVEIAAGTISIETKIGETEKKYELAAASQEGGQASKFALTDPSLVEALKAVGPGIEAKIVVNVNDAIVTGEFEAHAHGAHKH